MRIAISDDGVMAWAAPAHLAIEHERAAAGQHRNAFSIQIGSRDRFGPSDANVVGAGRAFATLIE
jgi:hypothetical protein